MELKYLFLFLTVYIIVLMLVIQTNCEKHNKRSLENYANTSISNEALANIASIYNGETLTANNIVSSGNINVNNLTAVNSTTTGNMNANTLNATSLNATNFIGADIKLSKGWTSYTDGDNVTDRSEISNDTGTYKALMVVGNRSDGSGKRKVGVWDGLTVHGDVTTADGGRIVSRVLDGLYGPGGNDLNGGGGTQNIGSVGDCVNYCKQNYPFALTAQYRDDNLCWCKPSNTIVGQDNRYHTVLMV